MSCVAPRSGRFAEGGRTTPCTPPTWVHEAYFKLAGPSPEPLQNRLIFGVAARAMRGSWWTTPVAAMPGSAAGRSTTRRLTDWRRARTCPQTRSLALDDALTRLGAQAPRLQTVVEFRYFSGLTDAEIGELLGVSERTVHRDWLKARAWLYKELYPSQ
jgi:hypothetical protein